MGEVIAQEYKSALVDLNCNSKPYITFLTELAEENAVFAREVVQTILQHVQEVPLQQKLPCLYLVDSILKNVGQVYLKLFGERIGNLFSSVFEQVDEHTRALMYKLRQTWSEILPNNELYTLDNQVKELDPAWPVTAQTPPQSIYLNPRFLETPKQKQPPPIPIVQIEEAKLKAQQNEILKNLFAKQEQLRLLEQKKRELASKQLLSSECIQPTSVSLSKPNSREPVFSAKVNHRDPRLQKVGVALALNKVSQTKLDSRPPIDTKTLSNVHQNSNVRTLPSVVTVVTKPEKPAPPKKEQTTRTEVEPKLSEVQKDSSKIVTNNSKSKEEGPKSAEKQVSGSSPSNKDRHSKKKKDNLKQPEESSKSTSKGSAKTTKKKESGPKKSSYSRNDKRNLRTRSRSPIRKTNVRNSRYDKDKKQDSKSKVSPTRISDGRANRTSDKDFRQLPSQNNLVAKTTTKRADDSKENEGEPPEKKTKESTENDSDTDSLFGGVDQDYRQISESSERSKHDGWATYKAAHPDEFNNRPLQKISENIEDSPTEPKALLSRPLLTYQESIEFDRLGRPRLHRFRSKMDESETFLQGPRDFNRWGSRDFVPNSEVAKYMFHNQDREHILMQAEERYRLGKISQAMFHDIRKDLEAMRDSPGYHAGTFSRMLDSSQKDSSYLHPSEYLNLQGPSVPPPMARTFKLDNKMRTIHFVGDQALVLLDNNEPRKLSFIGEPAQVFIEGLEEPITLRFNEQPIEFELDGEIHKIKLGAPSRELYIDNHPYEGKFGGPPFLAMLSNGQIYQIHLSGPSPRVQVSPRPAYDLYEALTSKGMTRNPSGPYNRESRSDDGEWRPVRKPAGNFQESGTYNRHKNAMQDSGQWETMEESSHQGTPKQHWRLGKRPPFQDVQMVNSPHHTPPQEDWDNRNFQTNETSHHKQQSSWPTTDFKISASRRPRNEQMYNEARSSPQQYDAFMDQQESSKGRSTNFQGQTPGLVPPRMSYNEKMPLLPRPPWLRPQNTNQVVDKSRIPLLPPPLPPLLKMPNVVKPPHPQTSTAAAPTPRTVLAPPMWYTPPSQTTVSELGAVTTVNKEADAQEQGTLDIATLFKKLQAVGIIPKSQPEEKKTEEKAKKSEEENNKENDPDIEPIPHIELKLKSLRKSYPGVVGALYRGSQCASCGMRFQETHSEKYSRHLDWHFRVNRREKDGVRKAYSRKWYYEVEDWNQFEEFEDFEERARSFFEMQADKQYETEDAVDLPSVPASGQETEACVVCSESFQLFWVEEEEEWHLRNAVRHDGQAYHPSCYEDFVKATQIPEPINADKQPKSEDLIEIKQEFPTENVDSETLEVVTQSVEMLLSSTVIFCDNYKNIEKSDDDNKENVENMEVECKNLTSDEEIILEGKPGVEEIIGMITDPETDTGSDHETVSEKIVIESGGIVIKMRPESLKPASPAVEIQAEKDMEKTPEEPEEDDFRPPTPDPRFKNLPPVQIGTELSGLCCIM